MPIHPVNSDGDDTSHQVITSILYRGSELSDLVGGFQGLHSSLHFTFSLGVLWQAGFVSDVVLTGKIFEILTRVLCICRLGQDFTYQE